MIDIDADRGVILKLTALVGGAAIETIEIGEITFDEEFDPALFFIDEPSAPPAVREDRARLELRCAFCRISQQEVAKLIAGPGTFICNECVSLCNEIIGSVP
ncbi:MAG: hypothetical protein M3071_15595 [Actinomycetota bacterium]|nr:hypothetical protein [Actinomycetota bacterium]